jgi:hypothetical protein
MKKLQSIFSQFLLGDRRWGCIRFVFIVGSLLSFALLGFFAFHATGLLVPYPRFLLLSIVVLIIALWIGASYLKVIYERPKLSHLLSYLIQSLIGFSYPSVVIDKGMLQINGDQPNLIRDIGGPGLVVVQPGNLVLIENLDAPAFVKAEGVHFLSRLQTIRRFQSDFEVDGWEVPTLDERHGNIKSVLATTKDGITIIVEEIDFRYRLRMGREFGDFVDRDPGKPFPFSVQAVKAMAYNRTVRLHRETQEPELTPWHDMVNIAMSGAIADYIREHQFNDVVVPHFPNDPRQTITDKIFSKGVRDRLRGFGAELLWWDIGHFKIPDTKVADQLVESWRTIWDGEAAFNIARGKAEIIKQIEISRAEAQAELLIKTMDAFKGKKTGQLGPKEIRKLMVFQLTQLLDAMNDQGFLSSESTKGLISPKNK